MLLCYNSSMAEQKQKPKIWPKILKSTIHILLMIIFLAGMAMLLAWYVQYRYMGDDVDKTWAFFFDNPSLYWYSAAVIFALLTFLSAILRPFLATGLVSSVIIGLMFANQYKFAAQNNPLSPDDLQMVGQTEALTQFVDSNHLTRTIIAIMLILGLSVFLTVLAHQYWVNKKIPWWRRHALIQRTIIAIAAGVGLNFLIKPLTDQANQVHHGQPAEWMGVTELSDLGQAGNYEKLGFVSGFIYNLRSSKIEEPAGYNEERIKTLAMQYNAKQQAGNQERTELKDTVDKLIIILGESFYDPSIIKQYYLYDGGDVTPNLHHIFANHPYGYMSSPMYGGGTANIEFEVDTGLTNYWTNTIPFSTIVPYVDQIPAIANTVKKDNFYTATVHNYNGTLYKRTVSLPKEGFIDFFTEEQLHYIKKDPGESFINDYSAYHEVFDKIKNNDDKQLFNILTVQNHGPYMQRDYKNSRFWIVSVDGGVNTSPQGIDTAKYYESLYRTDQSLGEFINAIEDLEQRTAILFFGDHAGGSLAPIATNDDPEVAQLAYQTPYFIYTNFDIDKKDLELPTTSPNCLANTMYNVLNVKKSSLGYLLDEVCQENPILTNVYMEQTGEQPKQTDALKAYELINYDITNGQQYWMKYANQ